MDQNLALMFLNRVRTNPDIVMQYSKDASGVFQPTTYSQLQEEVATFAAGLAELGMVRGDKVGLIADNRKEWLVSDLAILGMGAADVPRGCDATEGEITYILSWSECTLTILENDKQLAKVVAHKSELPQLKSVVMMDAPADAASAAAVAAGLTVHTFADVVSKGTARRKAKPGEYESEATKGQPDDLATLIYTSEIGRASCRERV